MQNSIVFILDKNQNSREIIQTFLKSNSTFSDIRDFANYDEGYKELKQVENPIVIVDISIPLDNLEELLANIKNHTPKIIVTTTDYSTDTIIKALRLGAKEILPKPVLEKDLTRALDIVSNLTSDCDSLHSKIITVYSNKGGIGKTTIAINLAEELAKVTKEKVALVDLNFQLGDITTFLDIQPTFSINYVINKMIDQDEETFLKGFEKYKNSSLYILADSEQNSQTESLKMQDISKLFERMRKTFSYVIIDMASSMDPISLNVLDTSDWILFTTIVNIPAIRNAQRCLNLLKSRNYASDKVKVIINRYMDNDEIKIKDIENSISDNIYWKLPNNYFTIMESINKGVSIFEINPKSNISNSFRDLATKISDEIIEQAVVEYRK